MYKPTKIGSNSFIAGPSVISPSVTIGDGVIVSPLTFVDKDISNDKIVGGNREVRSIQGQVQEIKEIVIKLLRLLISTGGLNINSPELQEIVSHLSAE